jgi:hypothetical protein
MKLWQVVSRWLFSSPRKPSRTHHPALYRLDVDTIANELELHEEARKLARAQLPSPQQTVITAPEAKAVQRIEKARQDFVEWATFRLGIINESFARRDVTPLVNRALAADNEFQGRVQSQLAANEALLQELAANARTRQRELDEFRVKHGLVRDAMYPEGSATLARYALLLVLIICEGAANAYFFSQGVESGIIGGFIGAALFAALNVVVAFVLGKFGVPFLFHQRVLVKFVGLLGLALAIICIIVIGLSIAHFRDVLIADGSEPAKAAWLALKSAPFGLRDVNSWLLSCISVLFATFALFDGLLSDDRYPGYGRIDRRARAARNEYLDELQIVREQLEVLKEEELARLDEHIRKVRGIIAELETLIGDKESAKNRLGVALLDAENCLDALVKVFRDHNEIHRAGLARPPYFDWRPALQGIAAPDFCTDANKAVLHEQERRVERLLSRVENLRASIQACFNEHIDMLKQSDPYLASRH